MATITILLILIIAIILHIVMPDETKELDANQAMPFRTDGEWPDKDKQP